MRRAYILIVVLVALSPLFGVIGAEIVGYHEPLDVAADKAGIKESEPLWRGILPDYTFPGLGSISGYMLAGLMGVLILLLPALLAGRRRDES